MELDKTFALPDFELKISEIYIKTDVYSNLVTLIVVYKLPFSRRKRMQKIYEIYKAKKNENFCFIETIGYSDANCKTYSVMYQFIANGGNVIYSTENKGFDKNGTD